MNVEMPEEKAPANRAVDAYRKVQRDEAGEEHRNHDRDYPWILAMAFATMIILCSVAA